ncbi:arfaptin-2 [Platysternon megacephalum]|uniref:Arfaptin-2 n=1 Tax=Platysternon megacephalum TaxID=55544 RepID=A0A4D9DX81_9SAUR|nr:arfaptin-2 [Platysternon megacephalum]
MCVCVGGGDHKKSATCVENVCRAGEKYSPISLCFSKRGQGTLWFSSTPKKVKKLVSQALNDLPRFGQPSKRAHTSSEANGREQLKYLASAGPQSLIQQLGLSFLSAPQIQ